MIKMGHDIEITQTKVNGRSVWGFKIYVKLSSGISVLNHVTDGLPSYTIAESLAKSYIENLKG
jgi:hypothetical protein